MRVLQVHTRYLAPGGENTVVAAEGELLERRGHDVVCHHVPNPHHPLAAGAALAVAPWNVVAVRSVLRTARAARPDVAHVHNTWYAMSPAVIRALRSVGVPVVLTLHNYRLICAGGQLFRDGRPCETCVGRAPWAGVRYRCYHGSTVLSAAAATTVALHHSARTWSNAVEVFFAMNEDARDLFVRGGLPAERIRVKPNFVPDPGPRDGPAVASRTVLCVGRLSPEKGVDVLLDAWRQLADPSLELLVLGDGPARADLERRAGPGVRFAGHVEPAEVRRQMLAARALALPSACYEGADPLVALEAFAAGLPVLGTAVGGRARLLRPCGEEWLVPDSRPEAWAQALAFLRDANRIEAGSRRARAQYEARFTADQAGRALESAYESAVRSRSPAGR